MFLFDNVDSKHEKWAKRNSTDQQRIPLVGSRVDWTRMRRKSVMLMI